MTQPQGPCDLAGYHRAACSIHPVNITLVCVMPLIPQTSSVHSGLNVFTSVCHIQYHHEDRELRVTAARVQPPSVSSSHSTSVFMSVLRHLNIINSPEQVKLALKCVLCRNINKYSSTAFKCLDFVTVSSDFPITI